MYFNDGRPICKLEQFWGRLTVHWQVSVKKTLMGRVPHPTGRAPLTGRARVKFELAEVL